MSIVYKQKPEKPFEANVRALALLDDGIWRVVYGDLRRAAHEEFFVFIHEGMEICVDEGSFKKLMRALSDESVYDIVCKYNVETIKDKTKIQDEKPDDAFMRAWNRIARERGWR